MDRLRWGYAVLVPIILLGYGEGWIGYKKGVILYLSLIAAILFVIMLEVSDG